MPRKRLAIGLAVMTAVGALLAGCLNGSRSLNPNPPATQSPTASDQEPRAGAGTAAAAGPATGRPVTLVSAPGSAEPNPLNAERAYGYLKQICDLGRRPSGSPGMASQQKLLAEHFQRLGGVIRWQRFSIHHPQTGERVELANMIVQWHPERKERLLLSTHYDTRPFPDEERDPRKAQGGIFIGANDGGSGTALMMELAHFMPQVAGRYGVDFVLLDAEEFVFDKSRDRLFIGSEYFARDYVTNPPPYRYRWGVLLDMIGDRKLQIYQERNSAWWDDTRPLVEAIWGTAKRLGVREFIPHRKYEVSDDHLMLRNVGKIPTCDVIDFDYPVGPGGSYWHHEADTLDKCSGESLAKVGWVMLEWIKTAR